MVQATRAPAKGHELTAQAVKTRKQPRLTLGLKEEKTSMSEAFREEMESINTEVCCCHGRFLSPSSEMKGN